MVRDIVVYVSRLVFVAFDAVDLSSHSLHFCILPISAALPHLRLSLYLNILRAHLRAFCSYLFCTFAFAMSSSSSLISSLISHVCIFAMICSLLILPFDTRSLVFMFVCVALHNVCDMFTSVVYFVCVVLHLRSFCLPRYVICLGLHLLHLMFACLHLSCVHFAFSFAFYVSVCLRACTDVGARSVYAHAHTRLHSLLRCLRLRHTGSFHRVRFARLRISPLGISVAFAHTRFRCLRRCTRVYAFAAVLGVFDFLAHTAFFFISVCTFALLIYAYDRLLLHFACVRCRLCLHSFNIRLVACPYAVAAHLHLPSLSFCRLISVRCLRYATRLVSMFVLLLHFVYHTLPTHDDLRCCVSVIYTHRNPYVDAHFRTTISLPFYAHILPYVYTFCDLYIVLGVLSRSRAFSRSTDVVT